MAQVRAYLLSVLRTQLGPPVEGDPAWLFLARSCLLSCPPSCPSPRRPQVISILPQPQPSQGSQAQGPVVSTAAKIQELGSRTWVFCCVFPLWWPRLSGTNLHQILHSPWGSWQPPELWKAWQPHRAPSLQGAIHHMLAGPDQAPSQVWALVSPRDYEG